MATPTDSITTVSGRRCTRTRRSTASSTASSLSTFSSLSSSSSSSSLSPLVVASSSSDVAAAVSAATTSAALAADPAAAASSSQQVTSDGVQETSSASTAAAATQTQPALAAASSLTALSSGLSSGTDPAPPSDSASPTSSNPVAIAQDATALDSPESATVADAAPPSAVAAGTDSPSSAETTAADASSGSGSGNGSGSDSSSSSSSSLVFITSSSSPSSQASLASSPSPLPTLISSASQQIGMNPSTIPALTSSASASPSGGGSVSIQDGNSTAASTSSTIPVGQIVGGAVSSFIGLMLITFALYFCIRRRKQINNAYVSIMQRWDDRRVGRGGSGEKSPSVNDGPSSPSFAERARDLLDRIPPLSAVVVSKIRRDSPVGSPGNRPRANSQLIDRDMGSIFTAPSRLSNGPYDESPAQPQQPASQGQAGLLGRLNGLSRRLPLVQKVRDRFNPERPVSNSTSISPFTYMVEDPLVRRNSDPFRDPDRPPRLQLTNPDASRPTTGAGSTPRNGALTEGLANQQRPPLTPKTPREPPRAMMGGVGIAAVGAPPVAISTSMNRRNSNDPKKLENPFADPDFKQRQGLEEARSTPEWLRRSAHERTRSVNQALHSHPPSPRRRPTSSAYYDNSPLFTPSTFPPPPANPFLDSAAIEYVPGPGMHNRRSSMYAGPLGDSVESRILSMGASTFFGEPGPSRPTTTILQPVDRVEPLVIRPPAPAAPPPPPSLSRSVSRVSRATRGKSDPFDLDRPEVLGLSSNSFNEINNGYGYINGNTNGYGLNYGTVAGRREVRGSVVNVRQSRMSGRQGHSRRSSVPTGLLTGSGRINSQYFAEGRKASLVETLSWGGSSISGGGNGTIREMTPSETEMGRGVAR